MESIFTDFEKRMIKFSQEINKESLKEDKAMMKRYKEIMEVLKPYGDGIYNRKEEIEEVLKLKDKIVSLTFNEEHANASHMNLYDVYKHFEQMNNENGNRADEILENFEVLNRDFHNFIKGLTSGEKGEQKTLGYLDSIEAEHIILRNIELTDNNLRNEIDFVVITPHMLTIVEVKNTKRNIFISKEGAYYRTGEFNAFDCHIKNKMEIKEKLLRKAMGDFANQGIKIYKLLLFTDSRIEVHNQCPDINVCFAEQLPYLISIFDKTNADNMINMNEIKESILKTEIKCKYPIKFDLEEYKSSFAFLMASLEEYAVYNQIDSQANVQTENAEKKDIFDKKDEKEEEISKKNMTISNIVGSKYFKWVCSGIGILALGGTSVILSKSIVSKVFNR